MTKAIKFVVTYSDGEWVSTKAKTLSAAKRAAARMCPFQGQTLWVGVVTPSGLIQEAAVNRCDPITQEHDGWADL